MQNIWKHTALGALLLGTLAACETGGAADASRTSTFNTAPYRERVDDAYTRGDISAERAYNLSKQADQVDRAGEPAASR